MSLTSITCRTGEACAAIAEAGRPVAVPHVGALDPARVSHVVLGREVRPSSSYGTRLCLKKVQYGSVECRDQGTWYWSSAYKGCCAVGRTNLASE